MAKKPAKEPTGCRDAEPLGYHQAFTAFRLFIPVPRRGYHRTNEGTFTGRPDAMDLFAAMPTRADLIPSA